MKVVLTPCKVREETLVPVKGADPVVSIGPSCKLS